MKKILMVSVLILISPWFAVAEESSGAEQEKHKTTVTVRFEFEAGTVLSKKEMSEQLRREQLRNQQLMQLSEQKNVQKRKYIEELKRLKVRD